MARKFQTNERANYTLSETALGVASDLVASLSLESVPTETSSGLEGLFSFESDFSDLEAPT